MEQTGSFPVLPAPVHVESGSGSFRLTPGTRVVYSGAGAQTEAETLAAQLRPATGFPLPVASVAGNEPAKNSILMMIDPASNCESEGYEIAVTSERVIIRASAPAGLFYAAQTLRQLLPPEIFSSKKVSNDWKISAVLIQDFPRFGWRGMHLDVSRHFMPKDDVLRFIDTIASLKFNRFHWHLTDDQGWRVEIKKYPLLTEVGSRRRESLVGHNDADGEKQYDGIPHGGFYTQEEIREVVRYAQQRHVTILPEIDMPGHMQAAIAAYPELGVAEVEVRREWGISTAVLNMEPPAIQFCRDVLLEVMEMFPGESIHIGGDEVDLSAWEEGAPREAARRRLKEFFEQIIHFVESCGRNVIGWDEIREETQEPQNLTIMAWRGEEKGFEAVRAGVATIMTPCSHLYFDAYQAQPVEHEPLAIGGFIPLQKVYEYDLAPQALPPAERALIRGAQGQLWTEYMPDMRHVEYMAFPRACALAEIVWSPRETLDYQRFLSRMVVQFIRLENAGVNAFRHIFEQ